VIYTIYLSQNDSIFNKEGKWYHTGSTSNIPDNFFPYKDSVYYYIIDIRNYIDVRKRGHEVYKLDNKNSFEEKRKELGVDEKLDFTIIKDDI
jgi:hypothetical protein